ncbi:hypothetical protein WS62_24440 [Burkholderia sp. ABCPW 14]|uniref:hypothetical protein n=1 Tax=Burkholderia sp. ABCPW 14 TaxID=1637860 RepID=UPI000770BB99|nr:hypothetical protein [Burkholderia sp. ABCPW 14]KVD81730.1 hypothetical protein WS62_24440 [Burkholderia sp. ABCPW 14]
MALDSYDWLKIAASSAVIGSATGAIINGLFARGKDGREHDRESFLAALLAVEELEGYVRSCVQMIYTDSEAQQEAGRRHSYDPLEPVRLPPFSYSTEIQWKWLPKDVAAQLREFPNAHQETVHYIRNSAEFDDPFGTCDAITLGCARLGEQAWKLAATVRQCCGLPPAQMHQHGETALQTLRERVLKHEKRVRDLQSAPSLWPVPPGTSTQQAETGSPTN